MHAICRSILNAVGDVDAVTGWIRLWEGEGDCYVVKVTVASLVPRPSQLFIVTCKKKEDLGSHEKCHIMPLINVGCLNAEN